MKKFSITVLSLALSLGYQVPTFAAESIQDIEAGIHLSTDSPEKQKKFCSQASFINGKITIRSLNGIACSRSPGLEYAKAICFKPENEGDGSFLTSQCGKNVAAVPGSVNEILSKMKDDTERFNLCKKADKYKLQSWEDSCKPLLTKVNKSVEAVKSAGSSVVGSAKKAIGNFFS